MKSKRDKERFTRRLETEFSSAGKSYRGISSDFSFKGLFIRTTHPFAPGSIIDITVHLPGGKVSYLKGEVTRAMKTALVSLKNGMGILLLKVDSAYNDFIKEYELDAHGEIPSEKVEPPLERPPPKKEATGSASSDFFLLVCSQCEAKNKVSRSKISLGPKCGRCKSPLAIPMA